MKIIILFAMLFCHIVDDYYLQGILANLKQRKWWIDNASKKLYKYDYIIALLEHAFSWTFMVHLPIVILYGKIYIFTFFLNMFIHAVVDDLKANKLKINLVTDQLIHIIQVFIIWALYLKEIIV